MEIHTIGGFNEVANKIVDEVVEVVFKRWELDCGGGKGGVAENNFRTANVTTNRKYVNYDSFLSRGRMTEDQMKAVGLLLEGKTIVSPVDKNLTLKLVPLKV